MTTLLFLGAWAIRSSVLLAVAAVLLRALRVKDACTQLAVWTAVLCGSLAIPALTAALPGMPLPAVRTAARTAAPLATAADLAAPRGAAPPLPADRKPQPQNAGEARIDWAAAAGMVYALAAGALLLRLCVGCAVGLRYLRRSHPTGRVTQGIEIRASGRVASPVTLGVVRPAIVLPADWPQWSDVKLQAVLAHERSHIRRADPAVQMLSAIYRALVWFSPCSWYLHQRIVRTAEEASDDAAVAAIQDRASYAEVLLDFMQRGVRPATLQGVPMARYGRPEDRIHRILDAAELSPGVPRRSLAVILAVGAPLACLVAAATTQDTTPSAADKNLKFEVVSVKPFVPPPPGVGRKGGRGPGGPGTNDPGRLHYNAVRLKDLVMNAYGVREFQIVGPEWLNSTDESTRVTVDAIMAPETTKEQLRVMIRNLLSERFQLAIHRETRDYRKYSLVVLKNGPHLEESAAAPAVQSGERPSPPGGRFAGSNDAYGFPSWRMPPEGGTWRFFISGRGRIGGERATVAQLADELSTYILNAPVTDDTGLKTKYDFLLTFGVSGGRGPSPVLPAELAPDAPAAAAVPLPDLSTAIQEQLGLKLEQKKGPLEVIVIDHIEKRPTPN